MTTTTTESTPAPPTPAPVPTPTPPAPPTPPATGELGEAGKQAIERMKQERDDAKRDKTAAARELDAVRQELEQLKTQTLSDGERAVKEAETRGRAEATKELAAQLARAKFDTLAARRNADADTNSILEFVDMGKFVNDKGVVDETALASAVEKLVPEKAGATPPPAPIPSFNGGTVQTTRQPDAVAPGMDRLREGYREIASANANP